MSLAADEFRAVADGPVCQALVEPIKLRVRGMVLYEDDDEGEDNYPSINSNQSR